MSRGVNKFIVIGNVGRAPEMRYTPSGKAVVSFSVAVDEKWGNEEGQSRTEWVNVEAWGKAAETLNEYVKKGSKLYLCGKVRTDQWETDGVKHYRTKLIVQEFNFLGGGNGASEEAPEEEGEESFEFGGE